MIDDDAFIEWCNVHTNMYGTAKAQITKIQSEKKIPLLDIDVQGAKKFYKVFPQSNYCAILPPSLEKLKDRLVKRGTETAEKIEVRMKNSEWEMRDLQTEKHIFNYRVVNDDLEIAN